MYQRELAKPLKSLKSFFLFGPRGTGKTTWLKTMTNVVYLDLLNHSFSRDLMLRPELLEKIIPVDTKKIIIIDEIQKIPALLDEVHRLIEDKKYQFILTGSSARKLRKKGVNLLAGRAITYHLYPLTAIELGNDFSFKKAIRFGMLPSVWTEPDPDAYLKTYVSTYLQEEILQEGLSRSITVFNRFLEVASFSQGSLLNMSEIGRECGVDRKTIENYFNILEELLISYRLPIFTRRAKRKMVKHQKFYYFDTGVYRILRPKGPLDSGDEISGIALETLVLQEIVALNSYHNLGFTVYFWRTNDSKEVDFVLYGKRGLLAIEVKNSKKITERNLAGLRAFKEDYPEAQCYILYGGTRAENWQGIEVLPIESMFPRLLEILTKH